MAEKGIGLMTRLRETMVENTIQKAGDFNAKVHEALEYANIPTLCLLLVQLTGDTSWIEEPYLPTAIPPMDDHDTGGLPTEVQDEVRAAAAEAIVEWKNGKPMAIANPNPELMGQMFSTSVGEEVPEGYLEMVHRTMARASELTAATSAPQERADGFHAIIVGGGVSGLCMAIKLQSIGVPYTIVEKSAELGGTWNDNRYPGCGVDTPNHYYSYSFAFHDFSEYFCHAGELKAYLQEVAETFNLVPQVKFNTEVEKVTYDEQAKKWVVDLVLPDGSKGSERVNIVISAVGIFNPPVTPKIEGLDSFGGIVAHTGDWPDDLEWHGKRVAVVGSGASAMQLVPAMAPHVEELKVFQRTPHWSVPISEKWQGTVAKPLRWLMREVPQYAALYRERMGWVINDRNYHLVERDPNWGAKDLSLSETNHAMRQELIEYIESKLEGDSELISASIPDYPPFGKRLLVDHGWYDTLMRDNVELVSQRIEKIATNAIVTESGDEHEVDIIALATGYDVLRLLSSFEIYGRSGQRLRDIWGDDDGVAYWGSSISGFPNFFCLYGPNSQPAHGGSYFSVAEAQTEMVANVIEQMLKKGISEVEVREDVVDAYAERLNDLHDGLVWTHEGVDNYYRNSNGRIVINSPYRNFEFWKATSDVSINEFKTTR